MGVRGSNLGGINNSGIILHYDAGKLQSYGKSGLVVTDLSDSNTTGGLTGSTISWSSSNGGIIIFDGTSNQINVGTPTNLQFTNTQAFSISVWFKWTEASAAVGNLVSYVTAPPSATGWYLGLDRSGAIPGTNLAFFDFAATNASYRGIYTSTNSIIPNAWTNVVATCDSSNTAAGMKIYINGTLATTTVRSNQTPATPNYTGITAQVGARASDNTYRFEGNLSQVVIYGRELSAAQVLQSYNAFKYRISQRGIDTDSDNFLKSAHIEDATQAMAINNLVLDLKRYGIWSKMKALYPIVGGNAFSHAVNLKTPGTYNLTFFGTWTHGSTGMTPSSAYADTSFSTSLLSVSSVHLSYYSRTNNSISGQEMGALQNTPNSYTDLGLNYPSYGAFTRINNGGVPIGVTNSDSTGFYIASRIASNILNLFKNSSKIRSGTDASSATTTRPIYIGALNNQGTAGSFSNRQCALASIGDGLTDTEAANFYTAVQAFQTTLGRQV